jgi:hypothetical protein
MVFSIEATTESRSSLYCSSAHCAAASSPTARAASAPSFQPFSARSHPNKTVHWRRIALVAERFGQDADEAFAGGLVSHIIRRQRLFAQFDQVFQCARICGKWRFRNSVSFVKRQYSISA